MCDRLAMEFEDGWVVNLGIGIPTLCSNFDFGDKEIIFHAENGVIGYGPLTGAGKEDLHLVNAGGQHVTLNPGAAIVHHADLFGDDPQRPDRRDRARRLRGRRERRFRQLEDGRAEGRRHRRRDGSRGLRQARFVAMEQLTRRGQPRLVERCAIPVTAKGVVNLVVTNYGLFEITQEGMALREIAPGVTVDEVKAATGCNLLIPREVPPVRLRA